MHFVTSDPRRLERQSVIDKLIVELNSSYYLTKIGGKPRINNSGFPFCFRLLKPSQELFIPGYQIRPSY